MVVFTTSVAHMIWTKALLHHKDVLVRKESSLRKKMRILHGLQEQREGKEVEPGGDGGDGHSFCFFLEEPFWLL